MMDRFNREREHEDVYGKSFALYKPEDIRQFAGFFEERLVANGLEGEELFKGKRCVDAGCGNGRGALLMLKNGAVHVTALDVSEENLRSVTRNLKGFGFSNFTCEQTSLQDINSADETFDFVWCNGVLMHTAEPDLCLREITRILKVGGKSWIYVYGSNGLYWSIVDRFRRWMKSLDARVLMENLQTMGVAVRYIGEYMDDWKVPYLRSYTDREFARRLREVGFGEVRRLWRGASYDTSERLVRFPQDRPWLGEGDLRYLLTRAESIRAPAGQPLSNDEYGSRPEFDPAIATEVGSLLDGLERTIGGNLVLAVLIAANLQRRLRDMMTENLPFDVAAFQSFVAQNCDAAKTLHLGT